MLTYPLHSVFRWYKQSPSSSCPIWRPWTSFQVLPNKPLTLTSLAWRYVCTSDYAHCSFRSRRHRTYPPPSLRRTPTRRWPDSSSEISSVGDGILHFCGRQWTVAISDRRAGWKRREPDWSSNSPSVDEHQQRWCSGHYYSNAFTDLGLSLSFHAFIAVVTMGPSTVCINANGVNGGNGSFLGLFHPKTSEERYRSHLP